MLSVPGPETPCPVLNLLPLPGLAPPVPGGIPLEVPMPLLLGRMIYFFGATF